MSCYDKYPTQVINDVIRKQSNTSSGLRDSGYSITHTYTNPPLFMLSKKV